MSCNCHQLSSVHSTCDMNSGQCSCKDDAGVEGQRCDSCQPGFFNFDDSTGR